MKTRHIVFILSALFFSNVLHAQFGDFGDSPIQIDSEGGVQREGSSISTEENVVIQYGSTTIYSDYATYNSETRDVLVRGNVSIFTKEGRIFVGERALYNLETKQLRSADFRGDFYPFRFAADTVFSQSTKEFHVKNSIFTTSDSSKPDYYFRAKSVRIYPNDRVIFSNVSFYIGKTPVLWFPYIYQSLKEDQSFTITPGYTSDWGAFLLTQYTFPIAENISGQLHLDLRSSRGAAIGFDSKFTFGKNERSWGKFRSYYTDDSSSDTNNTGLPREEVDSARYRVSLQNRTYITDDIYASIDINKLSDDNFLEDFYENEFQVDPEPDNVISVTKWSENYTLTAIGRSQVNDFYGVTERLPELVLDIKHQPFFNSPIFYEGETGVARLKRTFAFESSLPGYETTRVDSFHQILYPNTYFGWLSFIPRLGIRGTYYTDSGYTEQNQVITTVDSLIPGQPPIQQTSTFTELVEQGSVFRPVFNAGFESSFKLIKTWDDVQSRAIGLDGLKHIVQPYTNFSYVYSGEDPAQIFQFDRFIPSTQQPLFEFPQFTSIDSIDNWTVWRLGVRNRLQTRRDNQTMTWLELDTYFNINLEEPNFPGVAYEEGTFSNVYNNLRFYPLPWVRFSLDSQLPLLDSGFTEVNSAFNFLVTSNLQLNLSHRYINGNPFFEDSSLVSVGGYYRLSDNWGFSVRERYEIEDGVLESQRYEIHRDLSSWVGSLGVLVRDNRGENEYGVLLTFTLKDLPSVSLPLNIDPESQGSDSNQ